MKDSVIKYPGVKRKTYKVQSLRQVEDYLFVLKTKIENKPNIKIKTLVKQDIVFLRDIQFGSSTASVEKELGVPFQVIQYQTLNTPREVHTYLLKSGNPKFQIQIHFHFEHVVLCMIVLNKELYSYQSINDFIARCFLVEDFRYLTDILVDTNSSFIEAFEEQDQVIICYCKYPWSELLK